MCVCMCVLVCVCCVRCVHYPMYITLFVPVYIALCTLLCVRCPMCPWVRWPVYIILCTLSCVHCPVYIVLCSLCCVHCAVLVALIITLSEVTDAVTDVVTDAVTGPVPLSELVKVNKVTNEVMGRVHGEGVRVDQKFAWTLTHQLTLRWKRQDPKIASFGRIEMSFFPSSNWR